MRLVVAVLLGLCFTIAQEIGTPSKRLTKYAEQWEARLGLSGWHTTVYLVTKNQLLPETLAHSYYNSDTHEFSIWVLRETEYREMELLPGDMIPGCDQTEISIVHEVVHLSLSPVKPSFTSDSMRRSYKETEEKVVVSITRALLTH